MSYPARRRRTLRQTKPRPAPDPREQVPAVERVFTAAKRAEYLAHLGAGMQRGAAAYVLEIRRHVIDGYIAENPAYELEVREAEATATEHVQEALYQAAVSGNVQAAKAWLALKGHTPRKTGGRAAPASPAMPDHDPELDALMDDLG